MLLAAQLLSFHLPALSQTVQVEFAPPDPNVPPSLNGWKWRFAVVALALICLYLPVGKRLVMNWEQDQNFQHGFLVPFFSAYIVWNERRRLAALEPQPSWSGLWVLVLGLLMLAAGVTGAELFTSRVSFLVVLVGLLALLAGWNFVRATAFPLAFLLLMIPIPKILFNQITSPLQTIAAASASEILRFLGVPVLREGNIIQLPKKTLEVAQACSGIRSLISLTTLAIIYGYLLEQRNSVRVALALASVPIAVIANSLRIVGMGLIVQFWSEEKAEGFYHASEGWGLFVVSLILLFLLHRPLQKLFGEGAHS